MSLRFISAICCKPPIILQHSLKNNENARREPTSSDFVARPFPCKLLLFLWLLRHTAAPDQLSWLPSGVLFQIIWAILSICFLSFHSLLKSSGILVWLLVEEMLSGVAEPVEQLFQFDVDGYC